MSTPNRDSALKAVLDREGPYTNRADDRGGLTVWGISRRMCPDWPGWAEFDRLDALVQPRELPRLVASSPALRAAALEWYRTRYWGALSCDYLPGGLAEAVFDAAVNNGVTAAGVWLQRSLNLLNNQATRWADLKLDGDVGPATLAALSAAGKAVRPGVLVLAFCVCRGQRYFEIGEKDPGQEVNELGWFNRLHDLLLESAQ